MKGEPGMMLQFDVFLSYSSVDKQWVIKLKDDLLCYGVSVWLDKDEIRPGDLFGKALEQALDNCRAVALIVSPEAINSGWVEEEYYRALFLAKTKQTSVQIIPVILRDAELPGFLKGRTWVNFRDETAYVQSVGRLVWGITGEKPAQVLDLSTPELPYAVKLIETLLSIIVGPSEFHFASYYGLELAADSLKGWLDKLRPENQLLVIAIVGEFNAGKSTLVNALLNREVAFTHHFVATRTLAFYYPEADEYVEILCQDGERKQIGIHEYLEVCKHPEELEQAQRVEVRVASSMNVVLLDTPGMGTLEEHHQDRAEEAVKEADAIVWVIDPNRFMGAQEGAFLRRARAIGLPTLVVVSKADDFPKEDIEKAIEWLSANLGYEKEQLIAISAQNHLESHHDPGVSLLTQKLIQMSATPQSIRAQSQAAKRREMVDEAVRLVDLLQEKLDDDSRWINRERELIRIQATSVRAHLLEFSRSEMIRQLRSHLTERVSESLQPDEVESALKHVLADFEQRESRLRKQLMQQVRDETMSVWKKQFVARQDDLDQKIEQLLSQPLERENQIGYLQQQLVEIAFREETVIQTIRTSHDISSPVGSTLLTSLGAALGAFLTQSLWGILLGPLLGLLGRFFFRMSGGELKREKTEIHFQRDKFIGKLCQEFGVRFQERLKRPLHEYLQVIEDEALQSMCKKKCKGLTVQQIVDAKQKVDRLQEELKRADTTAN